MSLNKRDKKTLQRLIAKTAKHRDALREIKAELDTLLDPLTDGLESLNDCIDMLSTQV